MAAELDRTFVGLTKEMHVYLTGIKSKFDGFDAKHASRRERIEFVQQNTPPIYEKLTDHFTRVWAIVKDVSKEDYKEYRRYYQDLLLALFTAAEVNRYIYSKPLGYAGDFRMMNYIFDHHDKYLGDSSFEMLINHYTCNITIARSNLERKDYFKERILGAMNGKGNARVLSVGGGSLRELIELLKGGQIARPLNFFCLDFEPLAIEFVKGEMSRMDEERKKDLRIEYLNVNVKDLLKRSGLKETIKDQDLVYISGVFDYLSDRFCSRLLQICWELLGKGGQLIVCNANKEGKSLRAYFELLGEWEMHFRAKADMLKWVADIPEAKKVEFEKLSPVNEYLFLKLSR